MLSDEHRKRVEAATVAVTATGGQGVLVPGGFVLTAAHCIEWTGTGGMALGDHMLETVTTKSGVSFRLDVKAAEPRADIAALSAPDNQALPDDADRFETWCENTTAVQVRDRPLEQGESVPAYVLTHDRGWLSARVVQESWSVAGIVWLEPDGPINGGTSGGPVVDGAGQLIGVVSWGSDPNSVDDMISAAIPFASLALPGWI